MGFDGAGTPAPEGSAGCFFFGFAADFLLEVWVLEERWVPGAVWVEDFCCLVGRLGFGAVPVDREVVVEDELELELELELLLLDEVVVWLDVVLVVVVEELEDGLGVQLSVSDCTTPCTGRLSEEIGVPGGTFTLNVYVFPPSTVTCTVHESAAALDRDRPPSATRAAPKRASTTNPRRLLSNVVLPSEQKGCGQPGRLVILRGRSGRY